MLGASTGMEAVFQFEYNRRTETLNEGSTTYKVIADIVKEYREITGDYSDELPDYFVTSHDIHWEDRVNIQAQVQKYVDSSISSTVNMPSTATVEEVEELYMYAWKCGLKGITVYVDGSLREGILTKIDDKKDKTIEEMQDDLNRAIAKKMIENPNICPVCGSEDLKHEGGCIECLQCSYSPCSI